MDPVKELNKVASEVKTFDERLAKEVVEAAKELKKEAALIEEGQKIVCVNPTSGLFKGRIYIADSYAEPNYLLVKEESGEDIGIFRADRFLPDWNAY